MIELAGAYNEDENDNTFGLNHVLNSKGIWMEIGNITTKDLQLTLKKALNKISSQDFDIRLDMTDFDKQNITRLRDEPE